MATAQGTAVTRFRGLRRVEFGFNQPEKVRLSDRRRIVRSIVKSICVKAAERYGKPFRMLVVEDGQEFVELEDGSSEPLSEVERDLVRTAKEWELTGEGPQPALPQD